MCERPNLGPLPAPSCPACDLKVPFVPTMQRSPNCPPQLPTWAVGGGTAGHALQPVPAMACHDHASAVTHKGLDRPREALRGSTRAVQLQFRASAAQGAKGQAGRELKGGCKLRSFIWLCMRMHPSPVKLPPHRSAPIGDVGVHTAEVREDGGGGLKWAVCSHLASCFWEEAGEQG